MSEQESFEARFKELYPYDDISGFEKEIGLRLWNAATAEANKRINALESEVAELKGEKVRHDQLVDYLKAGIAEELEQRILELQANNNDLREAFIQLSALKLSTAPHIQKLEAVDKIVTKALKIKPAESLAKHDAETIKRYADDLDNNHWVFIPHDLRKPLKGKQDE